jgi:hypothetical protein
MSPTGRMWTLAQPVFLTLPPFLNEPGTARSRMAVNGTSAPWGAPTPESVLCGTAA